MANSEAITGNGIRGNIVRIGVIGAGTMGNGIAQVAATSGFEVVLVEAAQEFLDRGQAAIDKNLGRLAAKGKITADESAASRRRIVPSLAYEDLSHCDLVVEAIIENEDAKRRVYEQLGPVLGANAILATNTSSISITRLGAASGCPERFIGMHFMNPVPLMQLVEVIRGLATSDATAARVAELAAALGKTAVEVHDYPGFVSNRILMPMINEAMYCLMEGVATAPAIDEIMKLGMNHPMGPLTLADFIGLDVCLSVMEVLYNGFLDSKYRPCPLLRKMVDAGRLGRKSGRGFYDYSERK